MKLDERKSVIGMILLVVLILAIPQLIRYFYFDNALLGEVSYYNQRIAQDILNGKNVSHDNLIFEGREYVFAPYHYMLAYFSYFSGIELGSRLLPFMLGILSFILFYYILKNTGFKLELRLIICSLTAISPAFIYGFTVSNKEAAFVFLFLLGLFLMVKENRYLQNISWIPFAIIPFFGLFETVLSVIGLFAVYLIYKRKGYALISIGIIALVSLGYYIHFSYNYAPPEKIDFIDNNLLGGLLSDLGAKIGFSIFTVFLALIGMIHSWKKKLRLASAYFVILILLIGSYNIGGSINIYLNFVMGLFAGLSLYGLIKRKWDLNLVKYLTIFVIVCGIIFSVISFVNVFIRSGPETNMIGALYFLERQEPGVVLSHYSNGFFIETIANKETVMDSLLDSTRNANQRYVDSKFIFLTRSLQDTKRMLKSYNVAYIFIDKSMKSGLVWEKEEQGLLFLFRNNETFKNIYRAKNAEVWEVIG